MTDTQPVLAVVRDALGGALPERYAKPYFNAFHERVQRELRPAMRILDVGAGRNPTISVERRPPNCTYLGLDISRNELDSSPPGSYDETFVGDVAVHQDDLVGSVDLIVSWQVLEHVRPMEQTFVNLRSYLRPGGRLVAETSGAFSFFAIADRILPKRGRKWLLSRLFGRTEANIFPAWFDRCWYSALSECLAPWSDVQIMPLYLGARYLKFSPPIQAAYLGYEELTYRHNWQNLASYYEIVATK